MLMLRFRDLTIPEGETIRRHQAVIGAKGAVWWGWIMRQDETFPDATIVRISMEISEGPPQEICLYHSGSGRFYRAQLQRISALPGGHRVRSPAIDHTPAYMHESVCPAWFQLTDIQPYPEEIHFEVSSLPTLATPNAFDQGQVGKTADASYLKASAATFWEVARL